LGQPYDAKKIEFNGKILKQIKTGEVEIDADEFSFGINKKDLPVYGKADQIMVQRIQVKKFD
jgi:hypothetical protein